MLYCEKYLAARKRDCPTCIYDVSVSHVIYMWFLLVTSIYQDLLWWQKVRAWFKDNFWWLPSDQGCLWGNDPIRGAVKWWWGRKRSHLKRLPTIRKRLSGDSPCKRVWSVDKSPRHGLIKLRKYRRCLELGTCKPSGVNYSAFNMVVTDLDNRILGVLGGHSAADSRPQTVRNCDTLIPWLLLGSDSLVFLSTVVIQTISS